MADAKTTKTGAGWDWEPKRRGSIYCSPACGLNCTHAAYLSAHEKARALAARLGAGWEPYVWENLGWHWSAINRTGRLKVHPTEHKGRVVSYTAFLGERRCGGRWTGQARTPEKAVLAAMRTARESIAGDLMLLFDPVHDERGRRCVDAAIDMLMTSAREATDEKKIKRRHRG